MDSYFSQITFDAEKHIYTLADQVLTSVTRVIARLQPPFDNDGWARRKAEERGVPVEVVLKEWEQKRLVSQDRGTRVHQHIEQVLRGEQTADPFLALNSLLPEMTAFNKFWQQVSPTVQVKKIEWVVGDGQLGIAGTVDALLYSEATGLYHIWEWKTGQAINSSNRFQTLLAPFSDLDDCKLIVYSLQSSLYRLIVERNTDLKLGDGYIVHLSAEGHYQIHKAVDLRDRLEKWLLSRNEGM